MVEFTKKEQEEIINDFLNKIKVNDIISSCKCKLINEKTGLTKLNLPNPIVKNICDFNYVECEKCFLLRNAKQVLHKSNLHSTLRQCIYDKYKLKFEENTFLNDDSSLRTYCFIKLNTFPTYEKVKKYVLQDNETYILKFYNDIKYYYEQSYEVSYGGKTGTTRPIEEFNNKMIFKFIDEYDLSNNKNEHDCKETFLNYIKQRNQELKIIIDKICDYIKDEQKNNIIGKLIYGDVINDIKSVLGNWSIGFCIYDFADRKYPFKNNKKNFKQIPKITKEYLNTNDFD